jgi:hypothetical protein
MGQWVEFFNHLTWCGKSEAAQWWLEDERVNSRTWIYTKTGKLKLTRPVSHKVTEMNGEMIKIQRLWICDDVASLHDDVASLHVKIDNFNNPLVRFCFIRNIDDYQVEPI